MSASDTKAPGSVPDKPVDTVELPTKPASEFLDHAKLELELRLVLRQEYENLFKIWKNTELVDLETKQQDLIAKGLEKWAAKVKEEMKPPEPEDIQKLLDQEYENFTIRILTPGANDEMEPVTFTVRELPQTVEKRFYKQFRGKLIDKLQLLEAFTQAASEKTFEEKAKAFLDALDESFDILAEAVVFVLNPFGKRRVGDAVVDKQWVQDNIGSDRQWRIVVAQLKVNRLRDFFSNVSTSGQTMTMMTSPNFRTLQGLVA